MDKEMDRLISEKMAQGLGDEEIMEQIISGRAKGVKTNMDVWELEDQKINELMQEMQKKGKKPISMEDSVMFGD